LTASLEVSYKGPGGVILRALGMAQQVLWIASITAHIGLVVRLFIINPRRYHWFITYLIVASLGALYLLALPVRSSRYTASWIVVEVALLFLLYAAALEIYVNLSRHFGGVDRRGRIAAYHRRILTALMALSLAVCIALTVIDAPALHRNELFSLATALSAAVLVKRVATSTLAVFLVISAVYFSRFRVRLQPNLRIHALLFTGWMVVSAEALLWRNVDMWRIYAINVVFLSLLVSIFMVWIVALKKSGESIPVAVSEARGDREILITFLRRLTRQR